MPTSTQPCLSLRLRIILKLIVSEKQPVEIACLPAQVDSLRRAGIHLVADMVLSGA